MIRMQHFCSISLILLLFTFSFHNTFTSDAQLNLTNVSQQAWDAMKDYCKIHIFVIMVFVFSVAKPTTTHTLTNTYKHTTEWCILSTIISILISCHLIIHIISLDFFGNASQKYHRFGLTIMWRKMLKNFTFSFYILWKKIHNSGIISYRLD